MIKTLKQYYSFNGRSTRSQFWGTIIVNYFVSMFVILLGAGISSIADGTGALIGVPLIFLAIISHFWVYLSVVYRRCNDAGISTWFTWLAILPYIALIACIVFGCIPTDKESN